MAKTGRPPKAQQKIDAAELKELLQFYPSKEETADWFKVSASSLERFIKKTFKETFDTLRNKSFVRTKIAIKRAQIKKALQGDNTMLIWCGKQYLGQKERTELDSALAVKKIQLSYSRKKGET